MNSKKFCKVKPLINILERTKAIYNENEKTAKILHAYDRNPLSR